MSERLPKRQGDIRLVPVDARPRTGRKYRLRDRGEGLVIAAGEATGHHHRVRDTYARVFEQDGKTILSVSKHGAELEHEEHDAILLEPGSYEVVRQREVVPPAPNEQRKVSVVRTSPVWD